ncbi:MAG TPA: OsmC family protein [Nocardioides sp.]|nr:OsmC family protein [Nocardioides sp.]
MTAVQDLQTVHVDHLGEDRFDIVVRGHHVVVDQPADLGGADEGPTPTELFVASLASCVAFYARRYLRRHDLPQEGLRVDADYDLTGGPARVASLRIRLEVPEGVPEQRRAALLGFASHCTVHNTLTHEPEIVVELA